MIVQAAAWVVFLLTYLGVATGRLPGFRLDRAGVALLGAALMVGLGVVSLDEAYRAIDWNTIVLLLGTMIVVAHLRSSGAFASLIDWAAARVTTPLGLLALILGVSAVASAFLVNDTVCLVLAPAVLDLTRRLGCKPIPYLLGLAVASNIGSVATITGNPQNMIIGSASGITYLNFAQALTPVAGVGLVMAFLLLWLLYRDELHGRLGTPPAAIRRRGLPRLNRLSIIVTLAMIVGFFVIDPVAKPAILAAAVLFLVGGVKPKRIYGAIDWSLLLMFAGLFVVTAAIEKIALTPDVLARIAILPLGNIPLLTVVAAVLSNLVSNVPAVLLLKPFVAGLPQPHAGWLCLAMASTLAGNFTVVGSVANIIVVEKAAQSGVVITLGSYFRLGAPLTLLTLLTGILVLQLRG